MNKLTKLLSVFVLAGAIGTGAGALAGCKPKHTHKYDDTWSSNENQHYHQATCHPDDKKARKDFENHYDEDENGLCDVCEYKIEEKGEVTEQMTEEEFKAAISATIGATNATISIGGVPYVKIDDAHSAIENLFEGYLSVLKDGTLTEYEVLGKNNEIFITNAGKIKDYTQNFAQYVKYGYTQMGLTALEELDYEDVEFDSTTGKYTVGNTVLTFADGKIATYSVTGSDMPEMAFSAYGTTTVAVPTESSKVYTNAVYGISAKNNVGEKLGTAYNSWYGLYASTDSDTDYVAGTADGFKQTITANREIYISFAGLKGNISGYFELAADKFGSAWDIVQFIGEGAKKFCVNVVDNNGTLKWNNGSTNNKDQQSAPDNAVTMSANTAVKVEYELTKANADGNYSLTLKINGSVFKTVEDLGVKTIDRITLVSSSGGDRKVTVDNVVICGEEMTLAEYKVSAQAKIDAAYYAAVGKGETGDSDYIAGNRVRNKENIDSVYAQIDLDAASVTSIGDVAQVVAGFIGYINGIDTDTKIKEAYDVVYEKITAMVAKSGDYTVEGEYGNKQAFEALFSQQNLQDWQEQGAAAKSVKEVNDFFADIQAQFEAIPTDADLAAAALNAKKAEALAGFGNTWQGYLDANSDVSGAAESVQNKIKTIWEEAVAAINGASSEDDVDEAVSAFASKKAVIMAIASGDVSSIKTAQIAELKRYAKKVIEGLDSSADAELIAAIGNENSGAVKTGIDAINAADTEEAIEIAYDAAVLAIDKLVAVDELNKFFESQKTALKTYVTEQKALANLDNAGSGAKVEEARTAVNGAVSTFDSTDLSAIIQGINSATEAGDVANKLEAAKGASGDILTALGAAKTAVAAAITSLLGESFTVTINGLDGIAPVTVKYGKALNRADVKEPDTIMIDGWYTGSVGGTAYDLKTPVYDSLTLYVSTKAARKTGISEEFKWTDIPTKSEDNATLTDDDFVKSNAFLEVINEKVVWRNKASNGIQVTDDGLRFNYAGGGVVTFTITWNSTGSNNESQFGLKGPDGNYIEAVSHSGRGYNDNFGKVYADDVDGAYYKMKGTDAVVSTFTLYEKGNYIISCPEFTDASNNKRGARITAMTLSGYAKVEDTRVMKEITLHYGVGNATTSKLKVPSEGSLADYAPNTNSAAFKVDGKKLVGWYTTSDCQTGTEFDFAKDEYSESLTDLYAKYEEYNGEVFNASTLAATTANETKKFYDGESFYIINAGSGETNGTKQGVKILELAQSMTADNYTFTKALTPGGNGGAWLINNKTQDTITVTIYYYISDGNGNASNKTVTCKNAVVWKLTDDETTTTSETLDGETSTDNHVVYKEVIEIPAEKTLDFYLVKSGDSDSLRRLHILGVVAL